MPSSPRVRGLPGGRSLRRHYGAGPLHLLWLLACFAFAGYVLSRVHDQGGLLGIVAWFVGGLVLHDLILWPVYALADRGALRLARRGRRPPLVPWINHVRAPVIMSGVLLGISFPLVLGLSSSAYAELTGLSESPYLMHWLMVTGILFGASAAIYLLRLGRAVLLGRAVRRAAVTGPRLDRDEAPAQAERQA